MSNNDTADSEAEPEFTEVLSRKERRVKNKVVPSTPQLKTVSATRAKRPDPLIGENTSSSLKIVTVQTRIRKKALFVSRFDPTVNPDDIQTYLKSHLSPLGNITVTRLVTKLDHYASFHVEVAEKDFPLVNNSSIWPTGVLIKEFFGRLTSEKCFVPPLTDNVSAPLNMTNDVAAS